MVFPIVGGDGKPTGYDIDNSLRFDGSSSFLRDTLGTPTSQKKLTLSAWTKGYNVRSGSHDNKVMSAGASGDGHYTNILNLVRTNGTPQIYISDSAGKYLNFNNQYFRDPSAWYHWVVQIDTTQGTATNRIKLYLNGTQISNTLASHEEQPTQNYDIPTLASGQSITVGGDSRADNHFYDGYIAELHFCDGQIHAPTEFGEVDDNGVWIPKEADVAYGNNGFFLEFKQTGTGTNASGIGADTSGNGNHLAVTGLAATDVTTDTPTNNFTTLNPLISPPNQAPPTYSEGHTVASINTNDFVVNTFNLSSGKWYWEIKYTDESSNDDGMVGIVKVNEGTDWIHDLGNQNRYFGQNDGSWGMYEGNGNVYHNGSNSGHGNSYTEDDILMFAMDLDNAKLYIGENGTWHNSGDPTSGATGTGAISIDASTEYVVGASSATSEGGGRTCEFSFNFGNPAFSISTSQADDAGYGNFEYDVPAGYYSICTKNIGVYG